MSTDAIVGAQDVLRAVLHTRRQGVVKVIANLESLEPDLAEYLMEETTSLHAHLFRAGASGRQVKVIDRRLQSLCCVLVLSLQTAYRRLLNGVEPSDEPNDHRPPGVPPADDQEGVS